MIALRSIARLTARRTRSSASGPVLAFMPIQYDEAHLPLPMVAPAFCASFATRGSRNVVSWIALERSAATRDDSSGMSRYTSVSRYGLGLSQ